MTAVARDAVFRALGDPTRRAILDRLRQRERGVAELCTPFRMSQPAISQHLKVLADAGLVAARKQGRERRYRLRPAPLREAFDWLGHFEQFWTERLDALAEYLEAEAREPGERASTKRARKTEEKP
ncbi:MAG TPA: metalloregulator ArsR/SmtB family transcription factor [Kofleriaceae bacterium]|jgi:DNA-binding transcriptional ArsR family regulator